MERYDVIVIGAGHAGSEAALACARLGCRTLVLTISLDNVALMPCNPSIGGPAKSTLVREIDALGGQMGINTDETYLQLRMLNTSKGPAVRALRAQVDRKIYSLQMKFVLESQENLFLKQGIVEVLSPEKGGFIIKTAEGDEYFSRAVILATGTYLRSRIFMGNVTIDAGPYNQATSPKLSECLEKIGIRLVRFKTGTPPRVNKRSLNFDKMAIQPGHDVRHGFSFLPVWKPRRQLPCWLTYTTPATHEIIYENLGVSALYSGAIVGTGPRYCPSIEVKVVKFPQRTGHHVFVEPEGERTNEVYLSGLSNSLPPSVQEKFLRTIPGLENVEIMRYGYAIEYDCLASGQFDLSLQFRTIPGLFTAGQVNGTSGYEEAAAQGIIAGINAARWVRGEEPIIVSRAEGYIGVLIDDLVMKGTDEPYRMLTGLAEHRLLLRMDNADERLTPLGVKVGLASQERKELLERKLETVNAEIERLQNAYVEPSEEINALLLSKNSSPLKAAVSGYDLLKRPELSYNDVCELVGGSEPLGDIGESVEVNVKYAGYIKKQEMQVERFRKMESKIIPREIDYSKIPGLSREGVEKLSKFMPETFGQASRISGVSTGDLSVLLIYLESRGKGGLKYDV